MCSSGLLLCQGSIMTMAEKDLGCYDSGGEAEPADGGALRVRETPAMRDTV